MKCSRNSHNLIITGVGGQGNVLISLFLGQAFVNKGYLVTIGETYGASQRGGAVMSQIRISPNKRLSPLIPKGESDIVLALEPLEALRVLTQYGNPQVVVLSNTRPIYPVDVTAGDETYPDVEQIRGYIERLSKRAYFIDATKKAMEMGSPIFGNMIMAGALLESRVLPLSPEEFIETMSGQLTERKLEINIQALEVGRRMIEPLTDTFQDMVGPEDESKEFSMEKGG